MGISVFPEPAGATATNDFILNKNNTTNNVFEPGRSFEAGGYSVVVTGSTAYDIYLLDSTGSAVGYTNGTSIVASGSFESISALGLGTADTVAFTYNGPSTNAGTAGTETGAGAYLTSITPSDLPQIDDTAIVAGGNFATNVQITFTSGTVELSAKNIVYSSSTALVVTRPDGLIEDNAPYDLVAVNPGVTAPSGSNLNVLSGTVTAGTDPSFVTTSPILGAFAGSAVSTAIVTSDTEGSVVAWAITAGALPPGLTLGTADGSIAGTVAGTASGTYNFTVQITDDGSNTNSASFDMPVGFVFSGTNANSTAVGGTSYYWWTTSGDVEYYQADSTSVEYLVIAGGGGGGNTDKGGGGGGAGGLLFGTATLTGSGSAVVTVGAGGANSASGNDSVVNIFGTAFAGGYGGDDTQAGGPGGSGGGAGASYSVNLAGGAGTAGQGFSGGSATSASGYRGGGGGGAGEAGNTDGFSHGGDGLDYGAWASAVDIIYDAGYFAGGGSSSRDGFAETIAGGLGGGGASGKNLGTAGPGAGSANSGGGGGGGYQNQFNGAAGGSGLVIARFS